MRAGAELPQRLGEEDGVGLGAGRVHCPALAAKSRGPAAAPSRHETVGSVLVWWLLKMKN